MIPPPTPSRGGHAQGPKILFHLTAGIKNLVKKINLYPTTNRPFTVPSQPIFRLGWCGNDKPSPRRNFHSIRRSGGVFVLFSYRKRTRPPAAMSGKRQLQHNYATKYLTK